MMYLTGFADEASQDLEKQIQVTKELGWNAIEARSVWGTNIHDISQRDFERVQRILDDAKVRINCFGSTIANWSKSVSDPFDVSIAEVERAIPRMHALDTKLIRIMSYARCLGKEQNQILWCGYLGIENKRLGRKSQRFGSKSLCERSIGKF